MNRERININPSPAVIQITQQGLAQIKWKDVVRSERRAQMSVFIDNAWEKGCDTITYALAELIQSQSEN